MSVVKSFNIYIDTDRGSLGSKGDDYQLHLNSVGLQADKGQFLRFTLNNFSMYRNFTSVNANNSRFVLRTSGGASSLDLDHRNYASVRDIAINFADKVGTQLLADSASAAVGYKISNLTPGTNNSPVGTTNNVVSFRIELSDQANAAGASGTANTGTVVPHGLGSCLVQFFEASGDSYALLGGNRIEDLSDTTTGSITTAVATGHVDFTCHYPAQRSTSQFVYVRSSLTSNTIETSSFSAATVSGRSMSDCHHSNILARVPIDTEFVQYDAKTGREFFMDLMHQKHIQNIRFYLTDEHGQPLPTFGPDQSTKGNLSFSMVLRVDVIQQAAPNERFTPDPLRSVPVRMSNVHMDAGDSR